LTTVHSAPVCGSHAKPLGLRKPVAKMRERPVARSISQIAARPSSCCMQCSATLLFEPTVAYSLRPSGLAISDLVQWWLRGPPGRSVTLRPGVSTRVCPGWYANSITASVLAT
jgi:hypothetical protein